MRRDGVNFTGGEVDCREANPFVAAGSAELVLSNSSVPFHVLWLKKKTYWSMSNLQNQWKGEKKKKKKNEERD